jgi:hypothetical protein
MGISPDGTRPPAIAAISNFWCLAFSLGVPALALALVTGTAEPDEVKHPRCARRPPSYEDGEAIHTNSSRRLFLDFQARYARRL